MNFEPTARTSMHPNSKSLRNISSTVTTYLRSAIWIHTDDFATSAFCLVAKHLDELIPTGIRYRFSEMMIMDHPIDIQLFDSDETILVNETSTKFMEEIHPLVSDLFMASGNFDPCFTSVIASFDFTTKPSLQSFESSFRLDKASRVFDLCSIGEAGEPFQSNINTRLFISIRMPDSLSCIILNRKTGIPFARLHPFDSQRLDVTFDRSMHHDRNVPNFGNMNPSIGNEFEASMNTALWIGDAFVEFLDSGETNFNMFSLLPFFDSAKEILVSLDNPISNVLQHLKNVQLQIAYRYL